MQKNKKIDTDNPSIFLTIWRLLPKEIWTFLALTLLSLFCLIRFVDLTPKIDENFFFSAEDPQFQNEKKISELFVRNDAQLIISATGDIEAPLYIEKIRDLSETLLLIDGVDSITSLSHGPKDLDDALTSPLWKRLSAQNQKSTNLIVLMNENFAQTKIKQIENLLEQFQRENFQLGISGLPYVVELIRRYLLRDLKVFTTLAFCVFCLLIYLIFRSRGIVVGTMITCLNACVLTFMIGHLLNIPIGLLTANLATIISVLSIGHMVFLTYNWKSIAKEDPNLSPDQLTQIAIQETLPSSFWSMLTTLLGFLSLLAVAAKPLRELGMAGTIGTIVAFISAYTIYPSFLRIVRTKTTQKKTIVKQARPIFDWLNDNTKTICVMVVFLCLFTLPGLKFIDKDPSMLSFFSPNSDIYQGLEYIDQNGGSSPLLIVAQHKDGLTLNNQKAFQDLWTLQESLESHGSVGSIISLPVLMAQARQEPLAKLLFWDWLLDILEKPQHGEIAKSFVTEDRRYGLFLLRMNELNRVQTRLTIMEELEDIVDANNFSVEVFGGIYALQGHLSKLVLSSLISGLTKLLLLFLIIAWFVSRSIRISFAMLASISLIPLTILGGLGLYRISLDVISSPASNVAIGIGIDAMIHLVNAFRRQKKKSPEVSDAEHWLKTRQKMWLPIMTSSIIVVTGFSIFLASTFPPTQRFGGAVVVGTLIAALSALFILPLLANKRTKATNT